MPVPPKRRPAYEGRVRRNKTFVLDKVKTITCASCKSVILPHRACPVCGNYRGKAVFKSKLDKKALKKMNKKEAAKKSEKETKETNKK